MQKNNESYKSSLVGLDSNQHKNISEDRMERAVIYARTKRTDQSTEYVEQVNKCSDYITKKGWSLCEIYFDEGGSGITIDRPEMSRMLMNAAKGCFDIVVVSDADRLTRSLNDLVEIHQMLSDCKVTIQSTNETQDAAFNSNQT